MEELYQSLVEQLTVQKKTIASMESCTGGGFANAITNIEGASEVLRFSAVTYSNEYKIKMGVKAETIEAYTVYSMEVAKEMSQAIASFAHADYGVGITGKINQPDPNNQGGNDHFIYVSIYDKNRDCYFTSTIEAISGSRPQNKEFILSNIAYLLKTVL